MRDEPNGLQEMSTSATSRYASLNFGLVVVLLLYAASASSQTSTTDAFQPAGTINGAILDDTGAAVPGASVVLSRDGNAAPPVLAQVEHGAALARQDLFPFAVGQAVGFGKHRQGITAETAVGEDVHSDITPLHFFTPFIPTATRPSAAHSP